VGRDEDECEVKVDHKFELKMMEKERKLKRRIDCSTSLMKTIERHTLMKLMK